MVGAGNCEGTWEASVADEGEDVVSAISLPAPAVPGADFASERHDMVDTATIKTKHAAVFPRSLRRRRDLPRSVELSQSGW
jgi:hypothetical protein